MALEFRVVNQDRDVKVISRTYVWKDETRAVAGDLDPARVIQIYGTDESVDRHNTIFRVDGWDLDNYRKNPVYLWAHNEDPAVSTMPLGRTISVQREEFQRADGKTNKRLLFDVEFPRRGTYPFADLACDMYKQGFLRAASVGFRNLQMRALSPDKDKEEMVRDGYDLKAPFAAELQRNALIELSAVPVGSNPNALAKAMRDAAPEGVRSLLDHDDQTALDDKWFVEKFEALRAALPPVSASETAPAPATDESADEPVSDAGADDFERELQAAVDALPAPPPTPPAPDPLEDFKIEMRQQTKLLLDELKTLRDELKQLRGAAPGVTETVTPPAEPAPSHLDELFAENVEGLERLATLFPRR